MLPVKGHLFGISGPVPTIIEKPSLTLEKWSEELNIKYDEDCFRNNASSIAKLYASSISTTVQFSIQAPTQNQWSKLKTLQVGNSRMQPVSLLSK